MEKGSLNNWCTLIHAAPLRLAAMRALLWEPGQIITIGWQGGDARIWSNIVRAAEMWTEYANIKFEWLGETNDANIRIAFNETAGSWSYLGRHAVTIVAPNNPTMNFGWFNDDTPWEEYRRTTVHEFGHMLGMIHEHQHPAHGIKWNKPAVYAAYEKNMGWSKEMVDVQIFEQYTESETQYSQFDPDSIMCYHIPAEYTLDGFTNGWNTSLSHLDKMWASIIYPGRTQKLYLPMVST